MREPSGEVLVSLHVEQRQIGAVGPRPDPVAGLLMVPPVSVLAGPLPCRKQAADRDHDDTERTKQDSRTRAPDGVALMPGNRPAGDPQVMRMNTTIGLMSCSPSQNWTYAPLPPVAITVPAPTI